MSHVHWPTYFSYAPPFSMSLATGLYQCMHIVNVHNECESEHVSACTYMNIILFRCSKGMLLLLVVKV